MRFYGNTIAATATIAAGVFAWEAVEKQIEINSPANEKQLNELKNQNAVIASSCSRRSTLEC